MTNGKPRERQTAVYRAGVTPEAFPWEKHLLPPVLYKYFPPERFHVLTDCQVRFSQRQVFEDRYELLPDVAQFGTADEILEFFETDEALRRHPPALRKAVVNHILGSPERHASLIADTQAWLTGPNEFVVFCLSEAPASDACGANTPTTSKASWSRSTPSTLRSVSFTFLVALGRLNTRTSLSRHS
jgi:hypothetical protein